jgi:hypothetical protein
MPKLMKTFGLDQDKSENAMANDTLEKIRAAYDTGPSVRNGTNLAPRFVSPFSRLA